MKLAESKRLFIFGEQWATTGAVGIGDPFGDIFIVNAHAGLTTGPDDDEYTGNAILSPLHVLRLTARIVWGAAIPGTGTVPTIRVSAYLIATQNQYAATAPRLTSPAEDETMFLRHATQNFRWQFNSQNVTVIRKKTLYFSGKEVTLASQGTTYEVKTMKLKARLKGQKEFEQRATYGGAVTPTQFLKGYNYYWVVISQGSSSFVAATTQNPINIDADRYIYYKDF